MKHALGLEPQLTLGLTARSPAGGGFQALASLSTSTTVKVLCVGWQLDHSAGESHVALMCVQGGQGGWKLSLPWAGSVPLHLGAACLVGVSI